MPISIQSNKSNERTFTDSPIIARKNQSIASSSTENTAKNYRRINQAGSKGNRSVSSSLAKVSSNNQLTSGQPADIKLELAVAPGSGGPN